MYPGGDFKSMCDLRHLISPLEWMYCRGAIADSYLQMKTLGYGRTSIPWAICHIFAIRREIPSDDCKRILGNSRDRGP